MTKIFNPHDILHKKTTPEFSDVIFHEGFILIYFTKSNALCGTKIVSVLKITRPPRSTFSPFTNA